MRQVLSAVVLLTTAVATTAAADEVTVFAAASLKNALDPIAARFKADTGHDVVVSYAGSNTLARQILAGAPADVFVSASEEWMDAIQDGGAIVPGTRRDLLGNRLVLIAHDEATVDLTQASDLQELLDGGKLAMALVDSVPAGQYGKQALTSLGLWDRVAPSVAQADNVRAALALVATGEAPFGIVYATDAVAEPRVHVSAVFPDTSHDKITYPVALTTHAADPADRQFLDALSAPAAVAEFEAQGFTVLGR